MSALKGFAIWIAILFAWATMWALLQSAGKMRIFGQDRRNLGNVVARGVGYFIIIACGLGLIAFLATRHL